MAVFPHGGEGSRTPVRQSVDLAFFEHSRCFRIPPAARPYGRLAVSVASSMPASSQSLDGPVPHFTDAGISGSGRLSPTRGVKPRKRNCYCQLLFVPVVARFRVRGSLTKSPMIPVETSTPPSMFCYKASLLYRTSRLCITRSRSVDIFVLIAQRPMDVSLNVALGDVATFVVVLFALAQAELQLHAAVL